MWSPEKNIEKLYGIKMNNRVNLIVNFCILLFLALCFWLIPKFSKKEYEKITDNWSKSEFSGVVDSLYCDYSNHAITTIYFKDGNKKTNLPQSYYYAIKKNDTIFKKKNIDTIFIKRENKILKLN